MYPNQQPYSQQPQPPVTPQQAASQQYPQQPYPQQAYQQQPYWPQQPPPQESKVSPGVLVGVSVWRAVIVACSFIGFGSAVAQFNDPWPGLSQQASLLNGIVYLGLLAYPLFTGGRRHEPASPWLRGAMAVLLVLVAVTFIAIIEGDLDETWSLFEHVITPAVVVLDVCVVGRNQANMKWWHPLTWVVFPLAYLSYFVAADVQLYRGFLDPDDGDFFGTVLGFLSGVIVTGYLFYGIAKIKTMSRASGWRTT
jgi:hypothetical protein